MHLPEEVKELIVSERDLKSDLVGLAVLAMLAFLVAVAKPGSQTPAEMWPFIYCGWAALAVFSWRHSHAPRTAAKWCLYALFSILIAALWYGLSLLWRGALEGGEPSMSKTFDLVLLLIVSPGFTCIAIAGAVRAMAMRRLFQT
jgi:hypothetical protein